MMPTSISRIYGLSNQEHLSSVLGAFGLSPRPIPSFRMKLFFTRFIFFCKELIQYFSGLMVLMGNAFPRAAGTPQV
jgi:hypothetical protein